MRLQPVQFIQHAIHRGIRDEVIDIRLFVWRDAGRLIDKRGSASKCIMRGPDDLGVGESLSAKLRREGGGEVLEGTELRAYVYREGSRGGCVLVKNDGENGLSAAGVLDRLGCEEYAVFCRGRVVGAV